MEITIDIKEIQKTSIELITYLEKTNLKLKYSIIQSEKKKIRIKIFRTDEFYKLFKITEHKEKIKNFFKKHNIPEIKLNDPQVLLNILLQCQTILRFDRYKNILEDEKIKYPKKIILHKVFLKRNKY